eukprot:m.80829 g.80829  ORF g.80829 m.80829 type:complete len:491 (+) comp36207_c0_seq4:46-1518(+)
MGNGESTRHENDDEGFVLVNSSSLNELLFDPLQSRAVCAGVGRHVNMRRRTSDIPSCDADTKLVADVLRTCLLLPLSNIQKLNSESEYAATVCNIEDSLRSAADAVGQGGVLFFYFSGHGTRLSTRVAIAGADFIADPRQLITGSLIVDALKALPSPDIPVVIILDCCFAAGLAREVITSLGGGCNKIYFLAACAAVEKTLGTKQLGAGIFTYFLTDYLKGRHPDSCLPLKALIEHCSPLCNALGGLLLRNDSASYGNLVDVPVNPTMLSTQLMCQFLDGQPRGTVRAAATDEADGPIPRFSQTLDLLSYEDAEQFEVDIQWSERVWTWLAEHAQGRLRVLKESGHLGDLRVYKTATCLMMQSMGMLAGKQRPDLAVNPATFLLSFYRMMEAVQDVVGKLPEGNNSDELSLGLAYYVPGVAKATGKEVKDLKKLLILYGRLRKDEEARQGKEKEKVEEAEEDEPDGVQRRRLDQYAQEMAQTAQPIEHFD